MTPPRPTSAAAAPPDPAPDVARYVEHLAGILDEQGFPPMVARVFAFLLVDDAPEGPTAGDLAEQLQVSPAAVSGAVRYLTQFGFVVRARTPGDRRARYQLRRDVWSETFAARTSQLSRLEAVMAEGIELLGDRSAAVARLEETRAFFEFVREDTPDLLERWHARRRQLRGDDA